ncbi:MAG: A/G-specific adenine glycosylase [Gemmatimonadetes bacterium]|nr:A/G-specific adenine glycosylase [Gemmatimonadota bacterium]
MPAQANVLAFRRRLLRWFRRHGRPLPWRATRDPYRVLVAEFMLQQTQVPRVLQYYERFLRQYPSLETLARAAPGTVREAWDGLGYYARARNLRRLAQGIVKHHDGQVPADPDVLVRLPGVGPYTAAAVATFAYEHRVIPVDTNIARVLHRAFGVSRTRTRHLPGRVARLVDGLLPHDGKTTWALNQALMDLGAMVCTARKPRCRECPVRNACMRKGVRGEE